MHSKDPSDQKQSVSQLSLCSADETSSQEQDETGSELSELEDTNTAEDFVPGAITIEEGHSSTGLFYANKT